jgi:hypothetical protein
VGGVGQSVEKGHDMKRQVKHVDEYAARRNRRFVQQSRLQQTACEGCSRQLHKTHFFVFYGNVCRPCWLASQAAADASGVAQDAEQDELFL